MHTWMRRLRGAIGMGLTWGVAWGVAGNLVTLGFLLNTGHRPDAPFPIILGVFGFVSGVLFAGVLGLAERRRPFGQMSLPRFAMWGAVGGMLLATAFVLLVARGDPSFLRYLVVVGPGVALAGAASAAGSLALARRAQDRASLPAADGMAAGLSRGDARAARRIGD